MDDLRCIDHIKGLIIDGVGAAQSGHPGGAMSSLDFAYILFSDYLQFDPSDPNWMGRDRFILSAGHESMLMYSFCHLNGWLELDELKNFRQLGSKTPGHPENTLTPGVECTTGPLGQGAAMSLGFAFASLHFGAQLDAQLFNHKTYVLLGDGCMQEDITLGAASLAGHLKMNNLVWYYDRNKVQISGTIDRATSDDEAQVFKGFGWDVMEIDGHNHAEIRKALDFAQTKRSRPLLIIGTSVMAKGTATFEGSAHAHGAPLPAAEVQATKKKLNLDEKTFHIPEEAYAAYRKNFAAKQAKADAWKKALADKLANPTFKTSYEKYFNELDPENLPSIKWDPGKSEATRNSFGRILEEWAPHIPGLVGGSADLEPSNMTEAFAKLTGDFTAENRQGRNIAFGVREFVMSAMTNGIALHGGLKPFDATFLTFADYSRPALRLGAIQEVCVIHEFTHDSFYLGEDGPTHQPVEHLMSLRAMPHFYVMRPADSFETEVMFKEALKLNAPSAHCLSRQKLAQLNLSPTQKSQVRKGAYIVADHPEAQGIIFATGSEVHLALACQKKLLEEGFATRVVSVPCWELFFKQDKTYQNSILDWNITNRVAIEAGSTLGWQTFTGAHGLIIGLDRFGASGKAEDLEKEFGFTPDQVCSRVKETFQL